MAYCFPCFDLLCFVLWVFAVVFVVFGDWFVCYVFGFVALISGCCFGDWRLFRLFYAWFSGCYLRSF